MDKIICIVGESGSGKSTIAERLEKEGYNYIQSYTTRKKRYDGEKGHIFVDAATYHEFASREDEVIAYTYFNSNHYWATREQYRNKGVSVYVIDPIGVDKIKTEIKDAKIIVLYIKTDKDIRIDRMCLRKHNRLNVVDENILQRVEHDSKAFNIIKCDYVIDGNRSKESIFRDVVKIINYK